MNGKNTMRRQEWDYVVFCSMEKREVSCTLVRSFVRFFYIHANRHTQTQTILQKRRMIRRKVKKFRAPFASTRSEHVWNLLVLLLSLSRRRIFGLAWLTTPFVMQWGAMSYLMKLSSNLSMIHDLQQVYRQHCSRQLDRTLDRSRRLFLSPINHPLCVCDEEENKIVSA